MTTPGPHRTRGVLGRCPQGFRGQSLLSGFCHACSADRPSGGPAATSVETPGGAPSGCGVGGTRRARLPPTAAPSGSPFICVDATAQKPSGPDLVAPPEAERSCPFLPGHRSGALSRGSASAGDAAASCWGLRQGQQEGWHTESEPRVPTRPGERSCPRSLVASVPDTGRRSVPAVSS